VPPGEESIKGARSYRGAMASLLPISFGQVEASVVEAIVTTLPPVLSLLSR
jgi:hypothetical protein